MSKYSFETYWKRREESLKEVNAPPGLMDQLKFEAKKAWNQSKAMANEEILEANVVINRGIWAAMTRNNKNAEVIYQENNNE